MSFKYPKVTPLEDELLSSWLVRLAACSGLTPYAFAKICFGNFMAWCRDLDLQFGSRGLSLPSALGHADTIEATFGRLKTFVNADQRAITPGLLAYGIYHRRRRRHGLQYCPVCLFQNAAHFKQEWRFALQFGCPIHLVRLLDGCPRCDQPLMPHRRHDGNVRRCSECNSTLTANPQNLNAAEAKACSIVSAIFHGRGGLVGADEVPAGEYIQAARCLYSFITSRRMPSRLFDALGIDEQGIAHRAGKRRPLETSRIDVRAWAVPICVSLLQKWPGQFVSACVETKIYRGRITSDRLSPAPPWFFEGLTPIPCVVRQRRSRRTVRSSPKHEAFKAAFGRIDIDQYLEAQSRVLAT